MTKPSGPISIICAYDENGNVQPCLIDADGALVVSGGSSSVDAANVTYTPAVEADWEGSTDPGNQNQANDQLAERVKDLETDTIGSLLPVRYNCSHTDSFVVAGNAITVALATTALNNYVAYQYTPALNDQFLQSCVLKAGAYTLSINGRTSNAAGQLKIEFKHVSDAGYSTIVAAQEWYSGGSVYNVTKTATFTVTTPGRHIFRFTVATKNALSSDYYIQISFISIYLTAGDS